MTDCIFSLLTMINTCLKVPLQVTFFRLRHFALVSMQLFNPWFCRSVKNIHIKRLPFREIKVNFQNIFFVYFFLYYKRNFPVDRTTGLLDVHGIENTEVSILLSAAVLDTNVDLFYYSFCNQH
jgi:hypothetical protein